MYIISSIILAFSASLDSFIIGLAYGIKKININFYINLIISTIVTIGTFIAMLLGVIICKYVSSDICNLLGSILMILVGIWMIFDQYRTHKSTNKEIGPSKEIIDPIDYEDIMINNHTADKDNSGDISVKEAVTLSVALSINNFALGLSASISGINIYLTSLFTFIFSFLTLILGLKIGNSVFSKILGEHSSLISGIIIIIMGIVELLK